MAKEFFQQRAAEDCLKNRSKLAQISQRYSGQFFNAAIEYSSMGRLKQLT
jgi:hypothetical protein